jgi:hypothetical protein
MRFHRQVNDCSCFRAYFWQLAEAPPRHGNDSSQHKNPGNSALPGHVDGCFSSNSAKLCSPVSSDDAGRATIPTAMRAIAALSFALLICVPVLRAQGPTFQITGASYASTGGPVVPAGVNGAQLTLKGTLPSAAQQSQMSLAACFYTGYGSTAGLPLALPNGANTEPLVVPASTIQAIPQANYTSANGYSVTALIYFIQSSAICDGTFDSTLTNRYPVTVQAPGFGNYLGPTSVPQTNAATGVQAAPLTVTLPAIGILGAGSGGATTVNFGSFGSLSVTARASAVSVAVPAAFSSSPVGTTGSLSICNTFAGNSVCTTPTVPITLTVVALTPSNGTVTPTPNPVLTSGQTVLTAQFTKSASAAATASPGAPSGSVTFLADGTTLPAAKLTLDQTASFTAQTTQLSTPSAATPVITPAAGSFTTPQTITITDATPGAAIYYTQDGSVPTTASTLYTGSFSASTTETINAIAAAPGLLNSTVATAMLTIVPPPATQLAFAVQPVDTALNTAITPAVQVALEDANGNVVTGSSAPVTIALGTNPGKSLLGGTKTINAVNGVATFADLTLNNVANGYTLHASSGNLQAANSNTFNITLPPITMSVQSALVGIGSTLNGSFILGQAAPEGGLVVNLASSVPANATIAPASVTVPQGQTTGSFTYTGVASGASTLSATATGYMTGTVQVTGTAAQVSLGTIPQVAPGQMVSLALSLATPAPPGGTTVSFTIANTNIATVTSSVFVPAGVQTAAANPQITGVTIGTTTVTATAPGYAPAVRSVDVTVVASINPSTTSINLTTAVTTTLNISAPAQAGGIKFTLSSDDPTISTVPASVTIIAGSTSVVVPITGVAAGSTTIRADSPGVTEATGTVNVYSAINGGSVTTGYDLETSLYVYLPVGPPNPTTVTVTSNNPAVALISANPNTVGQTTLTFPNTTSSGVATIYVQGLSVGSTTFTISAPGYTNGTTTVTVDPTGFAFYYNYADFSTTTYSSPTTNGIYPVPLNSGTLTVYGYGWTVNPGSAAISVPITSSSPAVGTVSSPIVFHAGDTQQTVTFTPVSAGTATVSIGTPSAGFSVASQYTTAPANVTAPVIAPNNSYTGVHIQGGLAIYLPETPPAPVTVTLTTSAPGVVTLSNSTTAVGTTTLTIPNVTSTYVGTIYLQGQSSGTATLTESAPGYTSATSTLTVTPSGFAYYGTPSFSTTTFSSPTANNVYLVPLNSGSLTVENYGSWYLNPGLAPLTVALTDSATSVGTISPTSLTFNAGDNSEQFTFTPVAAGSANITIGTPTGFSTPSQYTQITATVTAPAISAPNITTGVHLQYGTNIYLPVSPPSPVTVTVTSSAPMVATLSTGETVAGVTTLTFTNISSTYVGTIYVQGQSVGTSTLTVSAPGYTSGMGTLMVNPSGFAFYGAPTFTTTTFSSTTNIGVYPVVLDPSSLNVQNFSLPLNPGVGPVTVPVVDSAPTVGTVSSNALVFNTGDTGQSFNFQPVSAGTANLSIGTPAGFTTPANYQSGTVTVTAPQISVNNADTGVNLETGLGIYLPVSPPNPVTVTVVTNGPLVATLSDSATVVGQTTLVFPNVTSTYVGTIYVQGQSLGATTVTVSAPGYINGNSTITVNPGGFAYYGEPNFTTSAGDSPTITVYAVELNPGTLTVANFNEALSPGLGDVDVPISSSDTSVGTVMSPFVFTPGMGSASTPFQALATGNTNLTLSTPSGFSTPSQYTQIVGTVQ